MPIYLGKEQIIEVYGGQSRINNIYVGQTGVYGESAPEIELIDWTPDVISTFIWLDANDLDTLTIGPVRSGSGKNRVTDWNDKSGNGRHFYDPDLFDAPLLISGDPLMNNLYTIEWTHDNEDRLYHELTSTTSPDSWAGFFAYNQYDFTADEQYLLDVEAGRVMFAAYDQSEADPGIYNGSSWVGHTTNDFTVGPQILEFVLDGASSGIYRNGLERASFDAGSPISFGATIGLGARFNQSYDSNLQGSIGETIIVKGQVSTDTRQKIEGYLAHKWGLESNLPADHPYKAEKPMISA